MSDLSHTVPLSTEQCRYLEELTENDIQYRVLRIEYPFSEDNYLRVVYDMEEDTYHDIIDRDGSLVTQSFKMRSD